MNGFFSYATDEPSYRYAAWFRKTTVRSLQHAASLSSRVHIFSPNCYHHGLSYTDIFWNVRVDGWSSSTLLAALLEGRDVPQAVIDDCEGLPCSPQTSGFADCLPVPAPQVVS